MADSPGPPYPPSIAQVGGIPSILPDIPIASCFLALFVASAATHMTVFQRNRRRGHKFVFSTLCFGFSITRITALVMRIVWATRATNTRIGLASSILTQVGVVMIYVINLFLAQRVNRAYHPAFGDKAFVHLFFRSSVLWVIMMIIMLIVVTIHISYTLDNQAREIDHAIQLFAGTVLAILAFLPAPIVFFSAGLFSQRVKKFGSGRLRVKVRLLLLTSLLLTLGAGFRVGANYAAPAAENPEWFDNKACYYVLNFGIDIVVSFTYALIRFDRRFYVPDRVRQDGGRSRSRGRRSPQSVYNCRDDNDDKEEEADQKSQHHPFPWKQLLNAPDRRHASGPYGQLFCVSEIDCDQR
ncbi:uncharacterized protein BCR38DRAFT_414350 [Pseudomassariella vexata]|uniref:Family c-likeg-protein-coupled receptor protein n=1 Tax=Pseudomassariella vexata TaxID=1141098 RepID=A0A1Y2DBS3_9PEZI|nr:uncharacterized protein BCR38DRAFT_414350 [Pseudomassariella vexata]ORY56594.1 hypothetical protein BCR38DRAFT_414350 [Pseudomassariella vexata]